MENTNKNIPEKQKINDATRSFVWNILLFAFGIFLLASLAGEPLDELALIRKAQLTEGVIYDADDISGEDEDGNYHEGWRADYSFKLRNGKQYRGSSYVAGDLPLTLSKENLPQPASIEYLPRKPSANRLQGSGVRSVSAWAKRHAWGGLFLLGIFAFSSYRVFTKGLFIWRYPLNPIQPLFRSLGGVFIIIGLIAGLFIFMYVFTKFYEWLGVQGDPINYAVMTIFVLYLSFPAIVLLVDKFRSKRKNPNNAAPNNSFNRSAD